MKRRRVIGGLPGDYRLQEEVTAGQVDGFLVEVYGVIHIPEAWPHVVQDTSPHGSVIAGLPGDYRRRARSADEKWHVDPVAGDDEDGDGSEGAPLRTLAEVARRLRSLVVGVVLRD